MATQITNGDGAANVSALNCIDLSSSDTHRSVSLLKQACSPERNPLRCLWFFIKDTIFEEPTSMSLVFELGFCLFCDLESLHLESLDDHGFGGGGGGGVVDFPQPTATAPLDYEQLLAVFSASPKDLSSSADQTELDETSYAPKTKRLKLASAATATDHSVKRAIRGRHPKRAIYGRRI